MQSGGRIKGKGVREWIEGDESGREMLFRLLRERPFFHLPPPLHTLPLRAGNVVELVGSSPSAKTLLLMQSAIHCILPSHYHSVPLGGLGRLVFFIDLDCRFDVSRLSQLLKTRISRTLRSCNCYAETKTDEEELFGACMRRFLYIRCYDSLQFLATLKTLHFRIQRESAAQEIGVSCLMIDSIGAFHWVERASTSFTSAFNGRKGLSLQNVSEIVVQEIKKLLLVHPMLVIASKGTIFGNNHAENKVKWNFKQPFQLQSSVSSVPNDMKQLMHREYMPSVWQSFVTLRLFIKATDDHISSDKIHNKPVYTSEWLLTSHNYVTNFVVEDAGIFCVP